MAGHYGSHQCDLPLVTLDLLLDTLKELHPKPDFFIYTGMQCHCFFLFFFSIFSKGEVTVTSTHIGLIITVDYVCV